MMMCKLGSIERRSLLVSSVMATLLWAGVGALCGADDERPVAKTKTVTLIVDYGDGVQKHFTAIAWREKMTVLDALQAAAKHPRGIKFESKGRGATVLVTKIDDLNNQATGNNWLYRVNEKLADRSCGVFRLEAGDTVLWRYEKYR